MKFLIHSNGPNVPTGYGVQVALLADRLASDGHEVAISATFGHQVGIGSWRSPSGHAIRVYPAGYWTAGDDILSAHADHWFKGNKDAGWIIALLDVWSLVSPWLSDYNVIGWAPVDHFPAPPGVLKFFERTGALPVALSKFGEKEFREAGLDPAYVPLSVDTKVYRPTFTVTTEDGREVSSRAMFGLPDNAFVVGMVAMNKDASDRKGFNEAFSAFGIFRQSHPDAVLFVHAERVGAAGGLNLVNMAKHRGIPDSAIVWSPQYEYRLGLGSDVMSAMLTSFDVLLCPSHGEGFGVPMIEAQACGTPVIASDFSSQSELIGAGWPVHGQPLWDQAQSASYVMPIVYNIVERLEEAYRSDLDDMQQAAVEFAQQYDADHVYETHWRPLLASLDPEPPADKPLMSDVAVLVPVMKRPQNVAPLVAAFDRWNDGTANLYFVCDPDDDEEIAAVKDAGATYLISDRGSTFACKLNSGFRQTTESFVFVCGDDVEPTPGWLAAARALSDRYDVIGTNDADVGEVRNPLVANGSHADHFFVRRSYVDEEGACLDGPGVLAPEAFFHYYTDVEIVELAKATGRFAPCLDSRVIHRQPNYEGRPEEWQADPVYRLGGEYGMNDQVKFMQRRALIDARRTVKGHR